MLGYFEYAELRRLGPGLGEQHDPQNDGEVAIPGPTPVSMFTIFSPKAGNATLVIMIRSARIDAIQEMMKSKYDRKTLAGHTKLRASTQSRGPELTSISFVKSRPYFS